MRKMAIVALGEIGDAKAIDPLILMLEDRDVRIQIEAIEALGKINEPRAVEALIAKLGGFRSDATIKAIVRIGQLAIEPLKAALMDYGTKRSVRDNAAKVLHLLKWQPENDIQRLWYAIVSRDSNTLKRLGQAAVEPLIAVLKIDNSDMQFHAVWALREIGDAKALKPLLKFLKDKAPASFFHYVEQKSRGNEIAIKPLIEAMWGTAKDITSGFLSSSNDATLDFDYLLDAIESLVDTLDAKAIEALLQVLEDDNTVIRRFAMSAISEVGAVEPLINALNNKYEDVRIQSIYILKKSGEAKAINLLVLFLRDDVINVRVHAVKALDALQWKPEDDTDKIYYLIARGDLDALDVEKEAAIEPLFQTLKKNPSKSNFADALARMGDMRGAEIVINDWLSPAQYNPVLENLFGDYAEIISKAFSYNYVSDRKICETDQSTEAIRKLCIIDTPISTNILHKITEIRDCEVVVDQLISDAIGDMDIVQNVNYQSQRDMAKNELIRRGNPHYDTAAYLDREAWKLK